jgi:hypothetical protein
LFKWHTNMLICFRHLILFASTSAPKRKFEGMKSSWIFLAPLVTFLGTSRRGQHQENDIKYVCEQVFPATVHNVHNPYALWLACGWHLLSKFEACSKLRLIFGFNFSTGLVLENYPQFAPARTAQGLNAHRYPVRRISGAASHSNTASSTHVVACVGIWVERRWREDSVFWTRRPFRTSHTGSLRLYLLI